MGVLSESRLCNSDVSELHYEEIRILNTQCPEPQSILGAYVCETLPGKIRSFFRIGSPVGVRIGESEPFSLPEVVLARAKTRDFDRARHLSTDVDAESHTSPESGGLNPLRRIPRGKEPMRRHPTKTVGRRQFTARKSGIRHIPI